MTDRDAAWTLESALRSELAIAITALETADQFQLEDLRMARSTALNALRRNTDRLNAVLVVYRAVLASASDTRPQDRALRVLLDGLHFLTHPDGLLEVDSASVHAPVNAVEALLDALQWAIGAAPARIKVRGGALSVAADTLGSRSTLVILVCRIVGLTADFDGGHMIHVDLKDANARTIGLRHVDRT